ncbi:thyroid receptor-interacting protein 11-like [Penaeus chinensis]|uniref:thyroid receptor-interacting protein 11-like n=1 Tax=Penaeus chinensis TaxID=139456 RepID=UPI001FB840BC|nr:thyroid receptor-interacting protein 11-like [Penaeus chinensis]
MLALKTSSDNKVDKPLLRNLMVGYFATPPDKRPEVLRILAEVLDFSSEERARTGLLAHEGGGSWLSSLAHFLAPPASNVRVTSRVDVLDHTSLSQAFIRFLEDESNPQPHPPRLPAVEMAEDTERKKKRRESEMILPIASIAAEQRAAAEHQRANLNSSPLLAAASTSPGPSPTSPHTSGLPTITTPLSGSSMPLSGASLSLSGGSLSLSGSPSLPLSGSPTLPLSGASLPLSGASLPLSGSPQGEDEVSRGLLPSPVDLLKGSSSGASNRFLSNLLKDSLEGEVDHSN